MASTLTITPPRQLNETILWSINLYFRIVLCLKILYLFLLYSCIFGEFWMYVQLLLKEMWFLLSPYLIASCHYPHELACMHVSTTIVLHSFIMNLALLSFQNLVYHLSAMCFYRYALVSVLQVLHASIKSFDTQTSLSYMNIQLRPITLLK
jgi:hypothetical protein